MWKRLAYTADSQAKPEKYDGLKSTKFSVCWIDCNCTVLVVWEDVPPLTRAGFASSATSLIWEETTPVRSLAALLLVQAVHGS